MYEKTHVKKEKRSGFLYVEEKLRKSIRNIIDKDVNSSNSYLPALGLTYRSLTD